MKLTDNDTGDVSFWFFRKRAIDALDQLLTGTTKDTPLDDKTYKAMIDAADAMTKAMLIRRDALAQKDNHLRTIKGRR